MFAKAKRAIFFTLPLSLFPVSAIAQEAPITPDGTVPTEVNSSGDSFEITGGAQAGSNLFHSFSNFSVPTGGEAFFNNAAEIDNIISRVTGGKISNIDGLIRANDSASLFLINPAGIVFGQNASLNIGGSFLGSTADSLVFPDGEFSATNSQGKPLLTINAPIGLNLRDNPNSITNNSTTGLEVKSGNNISLVGGDINLEGGRITAPAGRVELGSLNESGQVKFNENGSLSFPDEVARGNVSLTNRAFVDVTGTQGGDIGITADNIQMDGNSRLLGGTFANVGLPDSQSGDINLNATGAIDLDRSEIDNAVEIGNAGNIEIITGSLSLADGAEISNSTSGKGNAGNVTVNASDRISLNAADIFSNVRAGAEGTGGQIRIDTNNLDLKEGAQIQTIVREANLSQDLPAGVGNAGNITVNARGDVAIDGRSNDKDQFPSGLRSNIENGVTGNAGNIELNAKTFSLTNGAELSNSTNGKGDAGNVTIVADDTVKQVNADIFSNVESDAEGKGGIIDLTAKSLTLEGGAQLQTIVRESDDSLAGGIGDAGAINLNVADTVTITGQNQQKDSSAIFSSVGSGAEGNAGDINLKTRTLSLSDGAFINNSTNGKGNAGSVTVNVGDRISLDAADIFSNVESGAEGTGGNINIKAQSLSLTDGAKLDAGTSGEGNAGNVTINAPNFVEIAGTSTDGVNRSQIASETFSNGLGGNLTIDTGKLIIRDGGFATVATEGAGKAGNISIKASDSVELSGTTPDNEYLSGLTAVTSGTGVGGNINISTKKFVARDGAKIEVDTSGEGQGGSLMLNASDSVQLNGNRSGLSAKSGEEATGSGGNLRITTNNLTIRDGAKVDVSSFGKGGAGNLEIFADSINLDRAQISAATSSGEGGNINLTFDKTLKMRSNSRISAQASNDASGGNITINAPDGFIVAYPNQNNDIIATAQAGKGGQITINATSIYGFDKKRIQALDRSDLFNNGKNDINSNAADPNLSGNININTEQLDPVKKTSQSPQNTVEPDEIVAQACGAGSNGEIANSFTVTGRGGLPHSPTEPLNSEAIRVSGGQESRGAEERRGRGAEEVKTSNRKVSSDEIIPARGIAINEKGQVVLTRYPTPNTPQRITAPQQPNCSSSLTVEEFLAMDIKEHELDEWLDKEPVKSFLTDMLHLFIEQQH